MLQQAKAKIYLAENRKVRESSVFRNSSTLQTPDGQPCSGAGLLLACNDEVLAPGHSHPYPLHLDSTIILLPVTGSLVYNIGNGNDQYLEPGECLIKSLAAGTSFKIENPHGELINYLQLKLDHEGLVQYNSVTCFLEPANVGLVELMSAGYKVSIGRFDGREELNYELSHPHNKVFCFVIQGAFEVAYRLLHPRDGLCLWDLNYFEVESLSNNAVILFVEGPEELIVDE